MKDDEVEWDDYENVSATQCFLKYLEYPECEETPIDLKQGRNSIELLKIILIF